jgi:hypothetical protein
MGAWIGARMIYRAPVMGRQARDTGLNASWRRAYRVAS